MSPLTNKGTIVKKFAIAALLLSIGSAHAAGFDCNLASSEVENQICSDTVVSKLDEDLNAVYRQAVNVDPNVKVSQRVWVREVRNVTPDLEAAYAQRIADLKEMVAQSKSGNTPAPAAVRAERRAKIGDVDKALAEQGTSMGLAQTCVDEYLMTDEEYKFFKTTVIGELKEKYGKQYDPKVMKTGYSIGFNLGKNLKSLNYSDFSTTCSNFQSGIQKLQSKATVTEEDFE